MTYASGTELGTDRCAGPGAATTPGRPWRGSGSRTAAEAAVVAGRPAVVGDRVGAGRRPVGVQAPPLGGRRRQHGAEHVRPGRHRVRAGAPRGERVGLGVAGHADQALGLGVVGLEVGVRRAASRPASAPSTGPRALEQVEVLLPEAGQLAVGVGAAAADRRREVVHVAGEQAVAVGVAAAERAGLDQRVGPEEVALGELDLVVGELALQAVRRLEVEEVVAALLQDDDRPPGGGEDVGDGRAAGTAADDDGVGVEVSHRLVTSSSVQPRGCTSPGKPIDRQPDAVPVAAVDGVAVRPLAGVLVEQALEGGVGGQPARPAPRPSTVGEVVAQRGETGRRSAPAGRPPGR